MLKRLKFNTIFWKIFLSIWAAMLLIMMATTFTVSVLLDRDHLNVRRELMDKYQADIAVTLFESQGKVALEEWMRERHGRHARFTFLIDGSGHDVLGRPLPPQISSRLKESGRFEFGMGHHRGVAQPVASSSGEQYWFARLLPVPKPQYRSNFWHFGPPHLRGVVFLVALLVTGLISYWLAQNITWPIRQLQTATRKISGGDLSARVSGGVAQRRDELGDLGREFDRMAEHIEELLSAQKRMLRDVSHELRSPLARLQVALELARKSVGEQGKVGHDRIEREANRLDELIEQVLSLVRLTTNGADIEMASLDIRGIVEQVVADANYEAESQQKQVRLITGISFVMPGNAGLLHSALENIVRNAVKYSPANAAVEVNMSIGQEGELRICVRDYGSGVSEQRLTHIFEPFYREAEARDRASGGYGLGLAIAQSSIRLHGGEIRASNADQGGLIMEIVLPGKK